MLSFLVILFFMDPSGSPLPDDWSWMLLYSVRHHLPSPVVDAILEIYIQLCLVSVHRQACVSILGCRGLRRETRSRAGCTGPCLLKFK
jgi:hypothetical protein